MRTGRQTAGVDSQRVQLYGPPNPIEFKLDEKNAHGFREPPDALSDVQGLTVDKGTSAVGKLHAGKQSGATEWAIVA